MNEMAEEIQGNWKPSIGDFVYRNIEFKNDIKIICEGCYDVFDVLAINDLNSPPYKSLIWLPRQDQLQEILEGEYYFYFNRFHNFCSQNYAKYLSFEQLWLAFVMKEKYNKIWNGNDFIKLGVKKLRNLKLYELECMLFNLQMKDNWLPLDFAGNDLIGKVIEEKQSQKGEDER